MGNYLFNLFSNTIPGELTVFLLSIVPLVELRGGIIAAKALNIEMVKAFFICAFGTLLPIPFILLFIRQILDWMKNTRFVKLVDRIEAKAERKIEKIEKYKSLGLIIFVAIPLPVTGAWTGSLCAFLFGIPFKKSLPLISLGIVIAGIIVTIISLGIKII